MLSYLIFALWIPIIRHYKTKVSAQILLCISKDICSNGSCGASLSSHRIISHTGSTLFVFWEIRMRSISDPAWIIQWTQLISVNSQSCTQKSFVWPLAVWWRWLRPSSHWFSAGGNLLSAHKQTQMHFYKSMWSFNMNYELTAAHVDAEKYTMYAQCCTTRHKQCASFMANSW